MKLTKKGFTMMELLAAVAILGLLSIVAVIAIGRIMENGRRNYYEQQRNLILLAGKDYFTTNQVRLPREIGEEDHVTLERLIDQQYIGPIYDHLNERCHDDKSVVTVRRNRNHEFEYQVYLSCPNCTEEWCPPLTPGEDGVISDIIMYPPGPIDNPHVSDRDIVITVTIEGAESYHYTVRNTTTNQTRNSGSQGYNGEFTITLSEYGIYEVSVVGRVRGGEVRRTDHYIIDRPPSCGAVVGGNDIAWSNAPSRTISINCNSNGVLDCLQPTFDATFNVANNTTLRTGTIQISSTGGITRECLVNVNVDRIPPTTPVITNPSGGNATTQGFSLTVTSSDADSGIAHYQYSFDQTNWNTWANSATDSFTTPVFSGAQNRQIFIRSVDRAGNVSPVASTWLRIVTAPPTCGAVTTPTWSNAASRTVTVGCIPAPGAACTQPTFSHTFNVAAGQTMTNGTIVIRDNVGQSTTCTVPVRIDRVAPNCGPQPNPGWSNAASRNISIGCVNTGAAPCTATTFTRVFTNGANQTLVSGNIEIRDQAGNTRNCPVPVRMNRVPPTITGCVRVVLRQGDRPIPNSQRDICEANGTRNNPVRLVFPRTGATHIYRVPNLGNGLPNDWSNLIVAPSPSGGRINTDGIWIRWTYRDRNGNAAIAPLGNCTMDRAPCLGEYRFSATDELGNRTTISRWLCIVYNSGDNCNGVPILP